MIRKLISAAALLPLAACVTMQPAVPTDYKGPVAQVQDSGTSIQSSKGDFCGLVAIDGQKIANALYETRMQTQGKGMTLYPVVTDRQVPARPMKASLQCRTLYAAPIQEMMGKVYEVEGVVDFDPKATGRYRVVGKLGASGTSVWIEDTATSEPVTQVVQGKGG